MDISVEEMTFWAFSYDRKGDTTLFPMIMPEYFLDTSRLNRSIFVCDLQINAYDLFGPIWLETVDVDTSIIIVVLMFPY